MGSYLSIPILSLLAVLQATIVPQIRILGGGPDLVFLCVLSWSVDASLEESIIWAFVGGISQDLLSAAPTGTSCIGMLLLVFAINEYSRQVYRIGFIGLIVIVSFGTLVQQIMVMIVLALSGFQINWVNDVSYAVLPTIAYNLVFIWPIYWMIRRIQRRMSKHRVSL